MNPRQLEKIGITPDCMSTAIAGIQKAAKDGVLRTMNVKAKIKGIADNPESGVNDLYFGDLAKEIIKDKSFVAKEPVPYSYWGVVDENVKGQMQNVCSVPNVEKVSLMADSHYCTPIPVGAVVAMSDAISPSLVGSDISCMMKMSILDMPVLSIKTKLNLYKEAINTSTRFGMGPEALHDKPQHHPIMDQHWSITRVTREIKDRAWKQLGSSGNGNHFCDIGIVTLNSNAFGLTAGEYVAILSHSGSRGPGAAVCDTYDSIAGRKRPRRYDYLGRLSWLDKGTQEFYEYWEAMNFMGEYASANHEVIHRLLVKNIGANVLFSLENKHNFAWLEEVDGKEMYVHRKGATPAGNGVMGIIPGSMASPAFVVCGKGNKESINSASHGAGRVMSRRQANEKFNWKSIKGDLDKKGITVIGASAEEAPYVYKDIEQVMKQQEDLVDVVARFDPKIVRMAEDERR